ncbi:DNA-binding transcriptional LysR family regulator [Labrenzia sp. EL_126]|nr:DNA-binding transcriptional LysR family regulator [Labrenzia sp. EL_126]
MRNLRKNIPSPKALIAFEAAARHLNFTAAAEELLITQAAVTYQIQKLEQGLGTALFTRSHRRIDLTWAGERLLSAVSYGLGHIAEAAYQIRKASEGGTLTVAANGAVSFYWLRERALNFQIENPGMELRLMTGEQDDIENPGSGIDLAIRHGSGDWPGLEASLLFDEVAVPVCSPDYLARNGPFNQPADLKKARLLQLEPMSPDWITWEAWFSLRSVEYDKPQPPETVTFNSYPILLEAAIAGQGIALGGLNVIAAVLKEGRLVQMDDQPHHTGLGYYLVQAVNKPRGEASVGFAKFLVASL